MLRERMESQQRTMVTVPQPQNFKNEFVYAALSGFFFVYLLKMK
jgi:hypothetical protein